MRQTIMYRFRQFTISRDRLQSNSFDNLTAKYINITLKHILIMFERHEYGRYCKQILIDAMCNDVTVVNDAFSQTLISIILLSNISHAKIFMLTCQLYLRPSRGPVDFIKVFYKESQIATRPSIVLPIFLILFSTLYVFLIICTIKSIYLYIC